MGQEIMSYLDRNSQINYILLGNEYTEDILTNIRERERSPVLRIRRTSPQLGKRSQLVNWSRDISNKLQLHQNTFHLAIKLIDVFMDGHNIENPQLYLVALGGLLLAAKMEEDGNVPKCHKLNGYVNNYFTLTDFYSIEMVMLNYLHWNVSVPTSYYCAHLLLPWALLDTDKLVSGPILSYSKAHAYFEEYVQYFLRLSLQDFNLVDVLPSMLGVSIIAASRKAFGLMEAWPSRLERMSGYSIEELDQLVMVLLMHLQELSTPGKDEGYSSCTSSPVNLTSQPPLLC